MTIYKTNRQVYQIADIVDSIFSGFSLFCIFKGSQNLYHIAMGTAASPLFSGLFATGWSLLGFVQFRYLFGAYLQQVFLIDEVQLLKNLQQIRIRTMVYNTINLFALTRLNLLDKDTV